MPNAKRKTGEPQRTRQPFHIDRLPPSVWESIELLYNLVGKTWEQIEELSAQPYDPEWAVFFKPAEDQGGKQGKGRIIPIGGFVNWNALDLPVLEKFPDMRIPRSNLQRWYDVRRRQVQAEVLHRSAQARVLAKAFAKAAVSDDDEAVLNACRDTLMGVLSEDGSSAGRQNVAGKLIKLAEVQQKARANEIRERVVGVAERKIAQLEKDAEARRKRMDEEAEKLAKKASKGEVTPEDIDRLRERVFGMPPKPKAAA